MVCAPKVRKHGMRQKFWRIVGGTGFDLRFAVSPNPFGEELISGFVLECLRYESFEVSDELKKNNQDRVSLGGIRKMICLFLSGRT